MPHTLLGSAAVLAAVFPLATALPLMAQTDVLTWHNDNFRTGQNTTEAILSPANVKSATFGLLANVVVDGKVDAQPLYISALNIPGKGIHNVLVIVTEHDSVYAVDADTGAALWHTSLLGSGETTSDTRGCGQVTPEIGITATPAIDRAAGPHGTIYVVAMSKAGGSYYQRIHALDLATAAELNNGPVAVHATYPGTGDGSANGVVSFDPKQYKERPGLLLQNGVLYTSWGSHCDIRPYGGWLMAYNPSTLQQISALDFVPNGSDAAPWNAGAGPAADAAGNVYISLGNGTFDTTLTAAGLPSSGDYGNAIVKVALSNGKLTPVDYWTMFNSNSESGQDTDLGSGGLLLLPDFVDASNKTRHLAVNAGKDTNLYVADRDNLGHFNANNNSTLYQELPQSLPGGVWSSPAYFNSRVYYGTVGQAMRSFNINQAQLQAAPIQITSTSFGYPGTTPSISAYGTANGIVWATENTTPAVLHAYDANNLGNEFYNSNQAANGRDHFGNGNKFIAPTIANGKVYIGTQNSVGIFGLLRSQTVPLADGDYTLTNGASNLVLDDPGSGTAAGTIMYQWTPNGGMNQEWFFASDGNGFYTVQNVASKLFLTDANADTNGVVWPRQSVPSSDASQLWSITATQGGFTVRNKASGRVLDDAYGTPNVGQNIILYAANGGINQTWRIGQPLANGRYSVTNSASNLLLDDPGSSSAAGTAMYQSAANGGADEQWNFLYDGAGFYTIQNQASGLFLIDPNGATAPGTPLRQDAATQDGTALWSVIPVGAGFILQNKATSLVIDDAGGTTNAGPSIILWPPNNGTNQLWKIQ